MSGGRTAMTQSHSVHGGALSFMSCTSGRESSPLDENDSHQASEFKTETKKKRFHPLRNLRRMFRRKARHSDLSNDSYNAGAAMDNTEINTTAPLEQRSCSTSKLAEENVIQNLMKNNRLAPGLSLSHDSVFTPDRADSGLSSSDLENSSLSISNFVPPPMEYPLKSHSSCSESSLLSMDSSEAELSPTVIKSDLDLGVTSYKLSHNAAKHKMAVKPRRNHGVPRSKRRTMTSKSPLPSTPEVNEEVANGKGLSSNAGDFFRDASASSTSPPPEVACETSISGTDCISKPEAKVNESDFMLSPKMIKTKSNVEHKQQESVTITKDREALSRDKEFENNSNLKKPCEESENVKEDDWGERDDEMVSRKDESFFGRLLSRRSDKKKKNNSNVNKTYASEESSNEEALVFQLGKSISPTRISHESFKSGSSGRNVHRRQRVEPIEIPSSPSLLKRSELEDVARNVRDNSNRMKVSYSMSPPKSVLPSMIVSRSSSPPKVIWPEHFSYHNNTNQKDQFNSRVCVEKIKTNDPQPLPGDGTVIKDVADSPISIQEDSFTKIRHDPIPVVAKTKETQKIIADEMENKFKMLHSLSVEYALKNSENDSDSLFKDNFSKMICPEKEVELDAYKIKKSPRDEGSAKNHSSSSSSLMLEAEKMNGIFKREDEKVKLGKISVKSGSFDSAEKSDVNLMENLVCSRSGPTDLFSSPDVLITHEEPPYVNLKNILPVLSSYEKIHHGYENVQVIELVKKEKDAKAINASEDDKGIEKSHRSDTDISGIFAVESPEEKKIPKQLQHEKSKQIRKDVSDKTPEFMKVQLNKVEPRSEAKAEDRSKVESSQEKIENNHHKMKSTLIERRKSELMLTNESEEKDWKPKIKMLKKQTSFSESGCAKRTPAEVDQEKNGVNESSPPRQETVANEKTETREEVGEVVFRKKLSPTTTNGSDEQPELMKVFARRSLKVRESEEMMEEMRRSRDSDKENENFESPKEERKKLIKAESDERKQVDWPENETSGKLVKNPEEILIQVTPLKPEAMIRKCVFQKYGRINGVENGKLTKSGQQEKAENGSNGVSQAESRGKTRKDHSILEESKSNKMKETKASDGVERAKDASSTAEESEETGFKRIQQRKAEWERRVQQAAK